MHRLIDEPSQLAARRDIERFVTVRDAHPGDDRAIAGVLVTAFTLTYAQRLPDVKTDASRVLELVNIEARRRCGVVRVMELGARVIGTHSLMRPGTPECQIWRKAAANLRCLAIDTEFHGLKLSERLLVDAEAHAVSWGVGEVCLHVQQGADGVAKLYRGYGFERDADGDIEANGNYLEGYTLIVSAERVRARSTPRYVTPHAAS